MTYLELINAVLNRLREEPIASVGTTPYIRNIEAHVNDAKRKVEQAWQWNDLRGESIIAFTDGNPIVELPDSDVPDYVIKDIRREDTQRLRQRSQQWLNARTTTTFGRPTEWIYRPGREVSGSNKEISLFPIPNADGNIEVLYYRNEPTMTDLNDILLIPSLPVILYASSTAARERGEVAGAPVQEWFAQADIALSDAISYDSQWADGETDWDAGYAWPTNNRNYTQWRF